MANLFLPRDYVTKMHKEDSMALAMITGHDENIHHWGSAKSFQTVYVIIYTLFYGNF